MALGAASTGLFNVSAFAQGVQAGAGFTQPATNAIGGPPPINQPGTIPSGILPPACKTLRRGDSVLDCYLNDSSNGPIADHIQWYFGAAGPLSWKQWPDQAKEDLRTAFNDTVAWYSGGMQNYPGTLVQDPPPNLDARFLASGQPGTTILDGPTVAWPIYIGHVALSMAAEIYGWIPWSLHNYDNQALFAQLSYIQEFWYCGDYYKIFPTAFCTVQAATPGNAISTFKFLKTNNLIGATRMETIGRVLDWARNNLWHMGNALNFTNYHNYFQYWGQPPISRIIAGTTTTDPLAPYWWGAPHHWTAGCFGSTAFYIWILKAANVPVNAVAVGWHQAPEFTGEHMYLSHGDDPYTQLSKTNFPATMLLIDKPTYDAWFPANNPDAGDKNVGRRVIDLSFTYASAYQLNMYCSDIANGKDHASSQVYNDIYKNYYPLQYVESMGLWALLDQKMAGFACQF
jgi:hypothetical protein